MANEINIKSSTIEKGLDIAKDFLTKILGPTADEFGLYLADNIKYFRFKNQLKILLKAQNYIDKNNINIKEVPMKILVPLLEKASLEENEELQDKWSNMIANLVDSEQNMQNQIFPHLLSQISMDEYTELKGLNKEENKHLFDKTKLKNLRDELDKSKYSSPEIDKLQSQVTDREQQGFIIILDSYEKSNLIRLGLIKELPPRIYLEDSRRWTNNRGEINLDNIEPMYDTDDTMGYRITELGEKFLQICEINKNVNNQDQL